MPWHFPDAGNPANSQRYPLDWAAVLHDMAQAGPELLLPESDARAAAGLDGVADQQGCRGHGRHRARHRHRQGEGGGEGLSRLGDRRLGRGFAQRA